MAHSYLERTPEERDITLERIRMMADRQLATKRIRGSISEAGLRKLFSGHRTAANFTGEGFYRIIPSDSFEGFTIEIGPFF